MSKAALLQGGCLCFVILAVITVTAYPFALRDADDEPIPESCKNALIACALPAILPYIGLNETQMQERVRTTPLSEHCSDWTAVGTCVRNEINGDECSGLVGERAEQLDKFLDMFDYTTNYICQKHFNTFERNFHCLTGHELWADLKSSCDTSPPDPNEICETAIEYIDCSTGVVKTQCGNEISTVTKGLLLELFEKADAANDDVDCHSLKRANQISLLKKFFARL